MDREIDTRTVERLSRQALQRAAKRIRKQRAEAGSEAANLIAMAAEDRNVGRDPYPDLLVAMLLDWQSRQIEVLEQRVGELESVKRGE